jgi:hypothetical protein
MSSTMALKPPACKSRSVTRAGPARYAPTACRRLFAGSYAARGVAAGARRFPVVPVLSAEAQRSVTQSGFGGFSSLR